MISILTSAVRPIQSCFTQPSARHARITLLLAFFMTLFCHINYAQEEVRGLWVVRDSITSPENVKRLVEFADTNHFNVLFVQIRGRGDAYYNSYFVPGPESQPGIPSEFDPLEEIIALAHDKGIEVHAWLNMYFTWSDGSPPSHPDHPLNAHPEWFMVSESGVSMANSPIESVRNDSSEGRYMSPSLATVRSYLSRAITEVAVTYNIDGIHMDYVRYPGRAYDFHPYVIMDFENLYGHDPRDVVAGVGQVDPTLMYLGKWIEYRAEQINKQVRSIRRRLKLVDENIRLSAAVKAHSDEALYQFGQNWAGWLDEDIVDFVVTMSYFKELDRFYSVATENLQKTDSRKIVSGIGIYRLTSKQAREQLSMIRELNFLGYCMFSYTTYLENSRLAKSLRRYAGSSATKLPGEFKPYLRKSYD